MYSLKLTPWWHFGIFLVVCCEILRTESLLRNKRFLIFPRQAPTRHQFIGGLGIPADLAYESLTVGYVLKAEFFLPWNATVYRENPYFPEYKFADDHINGRTKDRKRSGFRWDIYEYIVNRLQNYGYNGQECLLKAICEANSVRFERHFNIFAELMHIFLSPSTSSDLDTVECSNYKEAEKYGRSGETCNIYTCNISLLNLISSVFKVEV